MTDAHTDELANELANESALESVTVIGLGLMGRALASALLAAGHPTTVWNRTAAKADDLVARGATLAPTVGDAVRDGSLIIVCLADADAVREAVGPHRAGLAGRTLVNLTSGTAEEAREIAGWTADRLDGAIMATPEVIGRPEAFLLYSGSPDAFEKHRETLGRLGSATFFGADPGLASLYDVALLGIMWGTLNAFLHGSALLGAAGVKASDFAPFAVQWVSSVSGFATAYAAQIDRGGYPAEDASLDTHIATMKYLVRESAAAGIDTDWPARIQALAERAVQAGHAGASYASLIEVFRGRA
ncbi:NAD(P)-dependent oxidoreductase [Actinomadura sp. WAC 06369]|uniref:NAD(P)-dependent oxidoreductase n=1 Tax=Actinomadura sp. WAC 06369 TaxID=2203193 RepID=UPI000F7BA6E9|nr:NAD(P)-binding domain-containing protein [Actinomadura sp. WAC 06369]RSN56829.1 6-phosphogluconate dehydrogenase [Actinomadura sp. WAC 06369]